MRAPTKFPRRRLPRNTHVAAAAPPRLVSHGVSTSPPRLVSHRISTSPPRRRRDPSADYTRGASTRSRTRATRSRWPEIAASSMVPSRPCRAARARDASPPSTRSARRTAPARGARATRTARACCGPTMWQRGCAAVQRLWQRGCAAVRRCDGTVLRRAAVRRGRCGRLSSASARRRGGAKVMPKTSATTRRRRRRDAMSDESETQR